MVAHAHFTAVIVPGNDRDPETADNPRGVIEEVDVSDAETTPDQ